MDLTNWGVRFAWLPTKTHNGVWVWLTNYIVPISRFEIKPKTTALARIVHIPEVVDEEDHSRQPTRYQG